MRIAIISSYPPEKCGVAILTKRLTESLTRLGHDVRVVCFKEFSYSDKRAVPLLSKKYAHSYTDAAEYICTNKFDIVLLEHEYTIFYQRWLISLLIILKLRGINVDIIFHTLPPEHWLKQIPFKLAHLLFGLISRYTIVHTDFARARLGFLGKKLKVIPIAIPLRNGDGSKNKKGKRPNALCFGFITYDKGTDIACEAASHIPDVDLSIVGTVYPRATKMHFDYLRKIEEYPKKYKNIHMVNKFVSEEQKEKAIMESDLVILPYRSINQSAILTEVWSLEKIPVCSDISAFKEEVNDKYGLLFRKDDPSDLADKINHMIKNKKRQLEILRNIRALVQKRSFDKIASAYADLK